MLKYINMSNVIEAAKDVSQKWTDLFEFFPSDFDKKAVETWWIPVGSIKTNVAKKANNNGIFHLIYLVDITDSEIPYPIMGYYKDSWKEAFLDTIKRWSHIKSAKVSNIREILSSAIKIEVKA